MARETLKDFLSSIGVAADSISYTLKEDGPDGLGIDPNTDRELLDLVNETQGLLGDYLKHIVDNSSNVYKLLAGNEMASPTNRGDSLTLAEEQGSEDVFVEQGTELASKLNEYSNSRKFDESGVPLSDLIDKTGNSSNFHESLSEIKGRSLNQTGKTLVNPSGEVNDIIQATQSVFLNNNRFANVGDHDRDAFAEKPQNIEEFEDIANNRGTLNPQINFGLYDKEHHKTSFGRLRSIGASLLLKSTGFVNTDTPGDERLSADIVAGQEESVAAGSLNSANVSNTGYIQKDVSLLRAKNASGFPADGIGMSIRAGSGEYLSNDPNAVNSKSFGATYNSVMTFSSKNRKVHKIQAAISIIALKSISKSFFDTFKEYLKAEDSKALDASTENFLQRHDKTFAGLYVLGQSRKLSSLLLDANLFSNILTPTSYPYSNCIDRGIEIMFSTEDDPEKVASHQTFAQSPGFWLAVSNSVLKTYDNILNRVAQIDTASFSGKEILMIMKDIIDENNFIRFLNVMATIGDVSLQSTNSVLGETNPSNVTRVRDVDALEDKPGNRVGKSRKANPKGEHSYFDIKASIDGAETLAWEQSATPSLYLLPINMIRAANLLNNSVRGASPMRGMLGSRMARNTYFSLDVDGTFNRIPNRVVKIVENKLEAEYVPFYFHDLRTNEILSFHAFLTQLSDSINPSFNAVSGYGRVDPVQLYQGTTRSLSVGFTVYATNREDFDEMWFKINKFMTLLYPQWTQGTMVNNGVGNFYQPFSQVVGPSPIIRLRVGDVIKSNYSRFALARVFGIGDKEVIARPADNSSFFSFLMNSVGGTVQGIMNTVRDILTLVWVAVFGSPIGLVEAAMQLVEAGPGLGGTVKRLGTDAAVSGLSNILVNGFANPLIVGNVLKDLRDPNVYAGAGLSKAIFQTIIIKPNSNTGYWSPDDNKTYFTSSRMIGKVMDQVKDGGKIVYKVLVADAAAGIDGIHLHVAHSNILVDPGPLFTTSLAGMLAMGAGLDVAGFLDALLGTAIQTSVPTGAQGAANAGYNILRMLVANPESHFMDPANNPYTRAFDTTKGRGVAGVIKGVSIDWLSDFPWETDFNARAPIGCDITFQFDVIHDIPPGLDHSGYNRAPLYNVGEIMHNIAGDPYGDDGVLGQASFTAGTTVKVLGDKKGKK